MSQEPYVCISGRFQPFHLDHLRYALAASERGETLVVAVTNPAGPREAASESAAHRSQLESNPLSFFVRQELILGSLMEAGLDPKRIRVTPMFLEDLDFARHFLPSGALHLLSDCDEWQHEKLKRLTGAGFRAEFVIQHEKNMTGTEVRRRVKDGEPFEHLLPNFVAEYILSNPDALRVPV